MNIDILYKLYQRDQYESYGFDNNPDRTKPNANDIVTQIMMFEREIFNTQNLYIIHDPRLFDKFPDSITRPDPFFLSVNRASLCSVEATGTIITLIYIYGHWKILEQNGYYNSIVPCDIDDGDEEVYTESPGGGTASGGGPLPPTPLPPCNGGWDRITLTEEGKYEGPCTPSTPIPPGPNQNIDPCVVAQNAAKKMDSLYNLGKADSMIGLIPNLATEPKEKGFTIFQRFTVNSQNVHDTTYTSYTTSQIFTGSDSSIHYTVNYPSTHSVKRGAVHTHNTNSYPAQSAEDIYSLIESVSNESHIVGNFVAAANGSQYTITITDPSLASQFLNTKTQFLNGTKWNEDSDIGKAFEDATKFFKDKYDGNLNRDNLSYEMAMAAVMKKFNTGITLSKKNASGNFKPIVVNTTTDTHHPRRKIYTQDCL